MRFGGASPRNQAAMLAAAMRAPVRALPREAPAMCGVRVTLGSASSGWPAGSGSSGNTSIAAPASWPAASACARAS